MAYTTGVLAALFLILFMVVGFTPISQELADIRSDAASESLGCTTGGGDTSCGLTLASAHLLSNPGGVTVTETSPGSATYSNLTLSVNRTTLTVAGLTPATAYVFTVTYLTEKVVLADNQGFAGLLGSTQILLLVLTLPLAITALMTAAFRGFA